MLVVDDSSPDGTGRIAEDLARRFPDRVEVLHREGTPGLGCAYRAGFQLALESEPDLICQMDADLSHDPSDLPILASWLDPFDLVIGSRYAPGAAFRAAPHRTLLSRAANSYVRTVTRLAVRDCTSGFRCWRRVALTQVVRDGLISNGYALLVEMLIKADRRGCRIGELGVAVRPRRYGRSKLTANVVLESLVTPLRFARHGL